MATEIPPDVRLFTYPMRGKAFLTPGTTFLFSDKALLVQGTAFSVQGTTFLMDELSFAVRKVVSLIGESDEGSKEIKK